MLTLRSRASGARRLGAVLVVSSVALVAAPVATAEAASGPSGVTASGAFLIDSTKNKTLWSKGADTKRELASTTKIMTAVTVLDTPKLDLNRKITVKQLYRDYVAKEGASTADLRTGDKLSVGQLLDALMLPSGCDAAYALADAFGSGSTVSARTKSFISKMNKKADALGMTKTEFDSFDGISQAGKNYSTPRDMAKLARHAMQKKTFRDVVKKKSSKQKATNGRVYTWYNTNKLLGSYNGAVGIKTGTGTKAGPCLVFAATRNGRTVAGVVLNDANRFRSAARMLDWAYGTNQASYMKLRQLPAGAQQD
ncbi:serine hydrolase [Streptomyces capparidis]